MRKSWIPIGLALAAAVALALAALPTSTVAAEAPAGQKVFEAQKCNLCHSVPAAGIEAKTSSEKMKGPDLTSAEAAKDRERLVKYIRKEAKINDADHKKEFKGTDEELQALVDWLLEQKAE